MGTATGCMHAVARSHSQLASWRDPRCNGAASLAATGPGIMHQAGGLSWFRLPKRQESKEKKGLGSRKSDTGQLDPPENKELPCSSPGDVNAPARTRAVGAEDSRMLATSFAARAASSVLQPSLQGTLADLQSRTIQCVGRVLLRQTCIPSQYVSACALHTAIMRHIPDCACARQQQPGCCPPGGGARRWPKVGAGGISSCCGNSDLTLDSMEAQGLWLPPVDRMQGPQGGGRGPPPGVRACIRGSSWPSMTAATLLVSYPDLRSFTRL